MNSPITVNRALIGLTDRVTGFAWAPLNAAVPGWEPSTPSTEARAVRAAFCLDRPLEDWYVVLALSLLHSFAELTPKIGLRATTYHAPLYHPPTLRATGGRILPSSTQGPPFVLSRPATWPVDFSFTATRTADDTAQVVRGAQTWLVPARVYDDGRVRVDWPAELNAQMVLQPEDWAGGTPMTITFHPLRPEAGVLDAVLTQHREPLTVLLRRSALEEAYFLALSEDERAALALLALIKDHPLLFP